MEPDEIDHAVIRRNTTLTRRWRRRSGLDRVARQLAAVNQDFTADRDLLKKALRFFSAGSGQGFEEGTTGTTEGTPDTGRPFTPDDTEYNIFNTDRRLEALRSVAEKLSHLQQKKSLIYFSNGMDRTGIENQSELRAATNAAVRANLAIYTMDLRGLQALVAGRRSTERQPAGHFRLFRPGHVQCLEFQLHHAGNAGHAGERHRRTRLSRFERFRPGLQGSAAGYFDVLSPGLSQHESREGRALSPDYGEGKSRPA